MMNFADGRKEQGKHLTILGLDIGWAFSTGAIGLEIAT
jgi:hypothetical protein